MIDGRVGADDDDHLGVQRRRERCGDGAGVEPLHQGRHRRGVAEARAVIHVVRAEAGAHQLLEQVRLLVRSLGRAKPGQSAGAVGVADAGQPAARPVERLLPARLAEMRPRVGRINLVLRVLGHVRQPNQRAHQAVRVVDVVEPETAFHAQPVVVRRPVSAGCVHKLFVLDLVGDLAAHPAIGAEAVHLAVGPDHPRLRRVEIGSGHQGAGRAGLHALPARHARRGTHRVVEIEHHLRCGIAMRHADDVVDLHLAAGADAQIALDARIEIDAHRRMAGIVRPARDRRETAPGDADALGPAPERRGRVVRRLARRLIGDQQLHHHRARLRRTRGLAVDLHAGRGHPLAGWRQHPLALDLHHAHPAVAVGPIAGCRLVAEMRDVGADAARHVPERLARPCLDAGAVELEGQALRLGGGTLEVLRPLPRGRAAHSAASLGASASGK
jgi:hypothetical protein